MSSLIEQAAERLRQLREAGVIAPEPELARPGVDSWAPPGSAAANRAEFSRVAAPVRPAEPVARQAEVVDGMRLPVPERGTAPTPNRTVPRAAPDSALMDLDGAPRRSQRVELDFDALAQANLITPLAPRSQIADQYRVIKRPLINNATGRGVTAAANANLIMVTSAVAGEGKSFSAVNLAMSIAAELDNTVMLVDADLARPSLPRMLGVPTGPGLLDVLDGTCDMADVLLRTNVDKLTVLRSGTPHARATELLASDAMRQLLDDMARRYSDRIIIFDSPPLLLTTEARALASVMGQIVVVVRADTTLQSDVMSALATIESCPVKMLLLNQHRADAAEGGYGVGYGYGYGYADAYRPEGSGA